MKKIIRGILYLFVGLIVIASIGWRLATNKMAIESEAQATRQQNPVVSVTTVQPQLQSLDEVRRVSGTLRPFRELAIMTETGGRLQQLNIENGSQVAEGSLLAVVDHTLLQQQLDISRLNLQKIQKDVQRLTNVAADGGVSEQQLDDARNQLVNLEATIRNLETQVSYAYVRSPFSGTIINKQVEKGAFVAPGMRLADLVQTNKLIMQAYVLEEQVVQLKVNQQAQVIIDIFPDQTLSARIRFIDVKADPSQRYLVEMELNNPGALRAGMKGSVVFDQKAGGPVLSLPRQAFVGSMRDPQIYVVENGLAKLRKIQTGQSNDQYVEIISGIQPSDTVVLSGQVNLADSTPVFIAQ